MCTAHPKKSIYLEVCNAHPLKGCAKGGVLKTGRFWGVHSTWCAVSFHSVTCDPDPRLLVTRKLRVAVAVATRNSQ